MQRSSEQQNRSQNPVGRHRPALFVALTLWAVAMVYLTLFGFGYRFYWMTHPSGSFLSRLAAGNFLPFRELADYLSGKESTGRFIFLFFGNIGVFIPLGLMLPILGGRLRRWQSVALIGLAATLTIEFSQALLNAGMFDVDDMLLNFSGTMLGYFLWRGWHVLRRRRL